MELKIYPRLNKKSKNAIKRKLCSWGRNYQYNPRPHLVRRLSQELGLTEEQVREQIQKERKFLLQYRGYY